jgi:hypothetical protein
VAAQRETEQNEQKMRILFLVLICKSRFKGTAMQLQLDDIGDSKRVRWHIGEVVKAAHEVALLSGAGAESFGRCRRAWTRG